MTTSAGSITSPSVQPRNSSSHYNRVPVVAAAWEYAAKLLGNVEPETVGQWVRGRDRVNQRTAAICLGYIAVGQVGWAVRFAKPITDALAGIRPLDLSLDLLAEDQRYDLAEDLVENEMRLVDPALTLATPEARATARRLAAAKERAGQYQLQSAAALRAAIAQADA